MILVFISSFIQYSNIEDIQKKYTNRSEKLKNDKYRYASDSKRTKTVIYLSNT